MQNLSTYYPTMLMAKALMRTLKMWDQGSLEIAFEQLVPDRIFVTLFQAAVRTLQNQNPDGSWGKMHSREETAYATLTLAELACLPPLILLSSQVEDALRRGRVFLANAMRSTEPPDYLWIEKVTYGLGTLSRAYVLAACKRTLVNHHFSDRLKQLCCVPVQKVAQSAIFCTKLPLFAHSLKWQVESSLIESYLFLPQLKRAQLDIFSGRAWDKFKYFDYIPFTWVAANYLHRTPLGAALQFDMMVFSLLVYQADEYMEAFLGPKFAGRLDTVKQMIEDVFNELDGDQQSIDAGISKEDRLNELRNLDTESPLGYIQMNRQESSESHNTNLGNGDHNIIEAKQPLRGFVEYILKRPGIRNSQEAHIQQLHREMKTFLLAHVTQLEDNGRFSQQEGFTSGSIFESPRSSFFHWVYHTSSDHTSCPFAFAFLTCRIAHGKDVFETVEEKYYTQAICRHLAVMCRMYNDHGSLVRDRQEGNLNSIDFPDFGSRESRGSDHDLKDKLFRLATYERKSLELGQSALEKVTDPMMMRTVRTFCDVTDMYGQMYVLKDLTSKL